MPHSPGPLAALTSEELFNIVHSTCDCHTPDERAQAWDLFRTRPDFELVMWNATASVPPSGLSP